MKEEVLSGILLKKIIQILIGSKVIILFEKGISIPKNTVVIDKNLRLYITTEYIENTTIIDTSYKMLNLINL